jgi:hypothetical protein
LPVLAGDFDVGADLERIRVAEQPPYEVGDAGPVESLVTEKDNIVFAVREFRNDASGDLFSASMSFCTARRESMAQG